MYLLLNILILLNLLPYMNSLSYLHHRYNRYNNRFKTLKIDSTCDKKVKELNFTAKVDNFDLINLDTFNLRYFINDEFVDLNTDNLPIFLNIGGEIAESKETLCYKNVMNLSAKKHRGLLLNLEHRFFGQSFPYFKNGSPEISTTTLSLLSPQQALADIANFIQNFEYKNFNFNNTKWVLFGGSYPGTLCAYMRKFYPELSVGGICSSAPLTPKLDFYEYHEVISDVYKRIDSKCLQNIKKAIREIYLMTYTDEGRQKINKLFGSQLNPCKSKNFEDDINNFFSRYIDYIGGIQSAPKNWIKTFICTNMTKELEQNQTYADLLADVINSFNDNDDYNQKSYQFEEDEARLSPWYWMTCNYFGWYQSTVDDEIYGNKIPLSISTKDCKSMFGSEYTIDYIQKKIDEAIDYFGTADTYNATNVALVNGENDPWHPLGCYIQNDSRHQIPILIPDAHHCNDMMEYNKDEALGLVEARQIIEKEIDFYLQSSNH